MNTAVIFLLRTGTNWTLWSFCQNGVNRHFT